MSRISRDNSTDVPLGALASYTGTWEDASDYESISTICLADTAVNVEYQFSTDSITTDKTNSLDYLANVPSEQLYPVTYKFYRIKVTNKDASPQTLLKVQTILSKSSRYPESSSVVVSSITDPIVVSSITNMIDVSSIANPIVVSSITNPVSVSTVGSITDPIVVSSITNMVDVSSIANPIVVSSITDPVSVSTFSFDRLYIGDRNSYIRDLTLFGGNTSGHRLLQTDLTQSSFYTRPASNVNVQIYSSSSGDTSIQFTLKGVDVNGDAVSFNLTTNASNGTTAVNTSTKQVVVVNDIKPVSTVPSGNITVKIDKDNNGSYSFTQGIYMPGAGLKTATHVVPNGRIAYLTRAQLSNGVDKSIEYRYNVRVSPRWTSGAAAVSQHVLEIYVNNTSYVTFNEYCEKPITAKAGELLYINTYTGTAQYTMANIQIIEADA